MWTNIVDNTFAFNLVVSTCALNQFMSCSLLLDTLTTNYHMDYEHEVELL
jgi:hypothetical protein